VAASAAQGADSSSMPAYEWRLPPGFPRPLVPADNPMSSAKVELGRRLFHETRLSSTGRYACASCHRPELAFTDVISGRSPFDHYVFDDDPAALSDSEKRGMALFFSTRVGCAQCH
jgi:cytochrome c peroxidase